jgi:hypothetical protein
MTNTGVVQCRPGLPLCHSTADGPPVSDTGVTWGGVTSDGVTSDGVTCPDVTLVMTPERMLGNGHVRHDSAIRDDQPAHDTDGRGCGP